jgi:hypothetical protein
MKFACQLSWSAFIHFILPAYVILHSEKSIWILGISESWLTHSAVSDIRGYHVVSVVELYVTWIVKMQQHLCADKIILKHAWLQFESYAPGHKSALFALETVKVQPIANHINDSQLEKKDFPCFLLNDACVLCSHLSFQMLGFLYGDLEKSN